MKIGLPKNMESADVAGRRVADTYVAHPDLSVRTIAQSIISERDAKWRAAFETTVDALIESNAQALRDLTVKFQAEVAKALKVKS